MNVSRPWCLPLGLLLFGLSGCMPFRYYPLPVSAAEATATFAPIATAASNLGYRFYRWPDSVTVEPDLTTRITYMFDASHDYVMCVMLKEKSVKDAPGGLEAAFAAGKAKGDDIWARAMALRPPAAVQYVVPAPQPGVQININP
jgi:hypothetical protein